MTRSRTIRKAGATNVEVRTQSPDECRMIASDSLSGIMIFQHTQRRAGSQKLPIGYMLATVPPANATKVTVTFTAREGKTQETQQADFETTLMRRIHCFGYFLILSLLACEELLCACPRKPATTSASMRVIAARSVSRILFH